MRREGSASLDSRQVSVLMMSRVPRVSSSTWTTWLSPSTCKTAGDRRVRWYLNYRPVKRAHSVSTAASSCPLPPTLGTCDKPRPPSPHLHKEALLHHLPTCMRKPPSTIFLVRTSTQDPFSVTTNAVGPLRATETLYLEPPMTKQSLKRVRLREGGGQGSGEESEANKSIGVMVVFLKATMRCRHGLRGAYLMPAGGSCPLER